MRLISLLCLLLTSSLATATILPPNDLHLEDHLHFADANINEQQFNEIIDHVMEIYEPIVEGHGASLSTNKLWNDSTVNASAQQTGSRWIVNMYGGLARRPEVTPDGFALVVCHELGHHLAGFPFYGGRWAASEGQSDYFATQSCARHIWGDQHETNALSREIVHPTAKAGCDSVYENEQDQNFCYRVAMGGQSLAGLLAALRNNTVSFDTPDTREVSRTQTSHPAGQCRLDTYFQGGLCTADFDMELIPGRNHPEGQTSIAAEMVAARHSCTRAAFHNIGVRPRCWYKPQVETLVGLGDVQYQEMDGNGNGAIEPGEVMSLMASVDNASTRDYEGITASVSSTNDMFEVVRGNVDFETIPANSSAEALNPFEVRIANDAVCGAKGNLQIAVQVGGGEISSTREIQIGRIVKLDGLVNNTIIDIPDSNTTGISSEIPVETQDIFRSVDVTVDIEHTYIGDLIVTLISPEGQDFVLHNRKGGGKDNLKETFSVELPELNSNGNWSLKVVDRGRSDVGRLKSWSAAFGRAVCE